MKYEALTQYLRSTGKQQIQLSFTEIESILGFNLGKSPYNHRAWWSNGGHSHASAWLDAGFKVEAVKLIDEWVVFSKDVTKRPQDNKPTQQSRRKVNIIRQQSTEISGSDSMDVCGYPFRFLQEIRPVMENRSVKEFIPDLKPGRRLNPYGNPPFCQFVVNMPSSPGVYLWIVGDEIIYIGEAQNLQKRFYDYGHIYAANCYASGRNTNCKMNKVVLEHAMIGQYVKLYFNETEDYKKVELELLRQINTKYNVKDN